MEVFLNKDLSVKIHQYECYPYYYFFNQFKKLRNSSPKNNWWNL